MGREYNLKIQQFPCDISFQGNKVGRALSINKDGTILCIINEEYKNIFQLSKSSVSVEVVIR